jgi:two-component system alkaline phosphatase synthesis response regulator PhoP
MEDKKLILVVDDNKSLVLLAQRILQKEGYDVLTAFNGRDGLQKAQETRPDLAILDIEMPEMDGYEVGRCLRQNANTAKIPLIFLTARGKVDNRVQADAVSLADQTKAFDECGACDFLNKPLAAEELIKAVKETLWLVQQLALR